ARELAVELHDLPLLAHHLQKFARRECGKSEVLAAARHGDFHEVGHAHPRYLHRILESEEDTRTGTLLDVHSEQVFPVVDRFAGRHLEARTAREHRGERTLARTVRAHDGMHLSRIDREVDAAQYL